VEFLEGQLQRSREFVRRMHERAARILSAEQLRRFDDYQAERLAIERSNVERARGNQ
jgi:hypothetical protein